MTTPTFKKSIQAQFVQVGKRRRIVGHLAELRDEGGVLLYSQSFGTPFEAEIKLDSLARDLLIDAAERGLIDTLPELAAEPTPDTSAFHFTRKQLNDLLFATIDMYLEFRDVHEHDADGSRFDAVDEMFQGLDADRELAQEDPTERLRLQLA